MLEDTKFLQKLKDYDRDHIPSKVIKILRKRYVNKPEFEPALIKKASVAAHGLCLCAWGRRSQYYSCHAGEGEIINNAKLIERACALFLCLLVCWLAWPGGVCDRRRANRSSA